VRVFSVYLYLALNAAIARACMKTRKFAIVTGGSLVRIPYVNHRNTAMQNIENMPSEMSLVDRVLQTFMSWGRNAITVRVAAVKPIMVVVSMWFPFGVV
jgi:hypothetical protein